MRAVDISNKRFGSLVAIRPLGGGKWLFLCDCGKEKLAFKGNVVRGLTGSCGCLRAKNTRAMKVTHGASKTKVYRAWRHMKSRCGNPNVERFVHYGGRGITVCDEWTCSFERFLSDMGLPPTDGHTLDRIDPNKGYSKDNCRWATKTEQARNKTSSKLSVEKVKFIKQHPGLSGAELGRQLGCSRELVNMVKRGEIWRGGHEKSPLEPLHTVVKGTCAELHYKTAAS